MYPQRFTGALLHADNYNLMPDLSKQYRTAVMPRHSQEETEIGRSDIPSRTGTNRKGNSINGSTGMLLMAAGEPARHLLKKGTKE